MLKHQAKKCKHPEGRFSVLSNFSLGIHPQVISISQQVTFMKLQIQTILLFILLVVISALLIILLACLYRRCTWHPRMQTLENDEIDIPSLRPPVPAFGFQRYRLASFTMYVGKKCFSRLRFRFNVDVTDKKGTEYKANSEIVVKMPAS